MDSTQGKTKKLQYLLSLHQERQRDMSRTAFPLTSTPIECSGRAHSVLPPSTASFSLHTRLYQQHPRHFFRHATTDTMQQEWQSL